MAFEEILNVIPKLSTTDLKNMEKSLSSRFVNAAKSFGDGLKKAISVGAIASLIEKFLNPLADIQASIDKTLDRGSSLSVQAKQFGSTSGELAKLHAFGAASGVEDSALNILIEKFQSAVVSATQNPGEHSAVKQFVGQTNAVQGFFDFIQNLKKLTPVQQLQVQEEVFGAKQVLRMSEFLHQDFGDLNEKFKDIKVSELTDAVDNIAKVSALDKSNKAHSALKDLINKDNALPDNIAELRNKADEAQLKRENDRIERFDVIQSTSLKIDKISENMETLLSNLLTTLPIITDGLSTAIEGLNILVRAAGPVQHSISKFEHWAKSIVLFGGKKKK